MTTPDQSGPLRVSVLGMDGRSLSTFKFFLQGPCRNQAVPVTDLSAEISVIDLDGVDSSQLFAKEREAFPERPIIVTSLNRPDFPGTIFVSKPIKAPAMMAAIDEARQKLSSQANIADQYPEKGPMGDDDKDTMVVEKKRTSTYASLRRSTHKTAMLLDEKGYSAFVGAVDDINLKDPHQVHNAHYDKKKYLQAYVQSAVKLARSRNRILQLNCGWKPITIFPRFNEIWIDADDRQLRAFCVVPVNTISDIDVSGAQGKAKAIISPVSPDQVGANHDPMKFQTIDAFIWKIALWTSNGRVPNGIELGQPVYLKHWPNLSRFVMIPHSLRIAALLIDRPMTLPDVAATLQIRQQYVFSFFSAAKALGLAGQSTRQADMISTDSQRIEPRRTGLLRKILNRLKVA